MRVAMVHQISGYGGSEGRMHPPPGVPFEMPDWEAEPLVRDGYLVVVPPEPPPAPSAPKQEWVDHAVDQGVPEAEAAAMTKAELIEEADAALPPETPARTEPADAVDPPKPADPKQAWMDYAVTQGITEDEAGMMTKADLMSRFGGRL